MKTLNLDNSKTTNNKELAEKRKAKAIDILSAENKPEKEEYTPKTKPTRYPPDVRVKSEKLKTYTIEIEQATLYRLCQYLQSEDMATAEGAIILITGGVSQW